MCLLLCISARYDYPLLYPPSHRGEPSSYDGKCLLVQLCLSVRPERGTTDLRRLCKGLPSSNMHVSRADFFHRCKHSMRYGPRYTMADCRSDGELDCFPHPYFPTLSTMVAPLRTSTGTGKTSSDE